MNGLVFEFDKFPKEHSVIGDMLLAYGEIEFVLLSLVGQVLDDDVSTGTRVLFRVGGEGARMEVADAILRPAYRKAELEGKWGVASERPNTAKTSEASTRIAIGKFRPTREAYTSSI